MYFSGILVAVAALIGVGFSLSMDDQASGVPAMLALFCGLFAAGGVAMILSGAKNRVVLHADAIEVFGMYRESRLARSEILGLRVGGADQGGAIRLQPRYTSGAAVSLPPSLAKDEAFIAWFDGIDNLDALERQASIDRYMKDDADPGTPEEKIQRMRSAARVSQVLTWVTLAAFAWAIFYPHPYRWVVLMLAVLPWVSVALAAFRGSVYRLDTYNNDVYINVGIAMLIPGFALALRALFDVQVLDWPRAAWLTAGGAIACMGIIYLFVAEVRGQLSGLLTLLVLMTAYSYGLVMIANKQLDRGEPAMHSVGVLAKRVTTGQGITRYLQLEPWGERKEAEEVEVDESMYESAAVGSAVCVYVFPGALGLRWYQVWSCPRD